MGRVVASRRCVLDPQWVPVAYGHDPIDVVAAQCAAASVVAVETPQATPTRRRGSGGCSTRRVRQASCAASLAPLALGLSRAAQRRGGRRLSVQRRRATSRSQRGCRGRSSAARCRASRTRASKEQAASRPSMPAASLSSSPHAASIGSRRERQSGERKRNSRRRCPGWARSGGRSDDRVEVPGGGAGHTGTALAGKGRVSRKASARACCANASVRNRPRDCAVGGARPRNIAQQPCKHAACYHCGWGGVMPRPIAGLAQWERNALAAGWTMPASRKAELAAAESKPKAKGKRR